MTLSTDIPEELLLMKPGKWNLVIIAGLKTGARRFSALRSQVGSISPKVLSSTLRNLERDGFIKRTHYSSIPPRVDYELTEIGYHLLALAESWVGFVRTHRIAVETARAEFDRNRDGTL
jgi:DNA-binding HxlR family transcriptional regulator